MALKKYYELDELQKSNVLQIMLDDGWLGIKIKKSHYNNWGTKVGESEVVAFHKKDVYIELNDIAFEVIEASEEHYRYLQRIKTDVYIQENIDFV